MSNRNENQITNHVGWEDVPIMLSRISWHLKRLADVAEQQQEQIDRDEYLDMKKQQAFNKLKLRNDPITEEISDLAKNLDLGVRSFD